MPILSIFNCFSLLGRHHGKPIHANGSSLVEMKERLHLQSTQQTDKYLKKVNDSNKAVEFLSNLIALIENRSDEGGKNDDAEAVQNKNEKTYTLDLHLAR